MSRDSWVTCVKRDETAPIETVNMNIEGHELTVYFGIGMMCGVGSCEKCRRTGEIFWYEPEVHELYQNGIELHLGHRLAALALEKLLRSGEYRTKLCFADEEPRFPTLFPAAL